MRFLKNIFITVILSALIPAATAQQPGQTKVNDNCAGQYFAGVILHISATDNGFVIKPLEIKLISGVYNDAGLAEQEAKTNDLLCLILNDKNEVMDSILISDPLTEQVEYSEDGKNLQRFANALTENTFLLRFNYRDTMKKISFERFSPEGTKVKLTVIDLDFTSKQ